VTLRDNSGNSTYHSLQTHVTKRAGGLTGQFSYTFSKALGNGVTRDQRNFHLSKGLLGVDRTHIVVANATYDLPFGKNTFSLRTRRAGFNASSKVGAFRLTETSRPARLCPLPA
jgi:hypothetical protein